MAITNKNLVSETYSLVKTFLETHVSDPTNSNNRKWIYASFPNITKFDFSGYPFIIINSPDVENNEKDFDDNFSNVFRVLITAVSDNESDLDNLSDSINKAFHDNELNGLYHQELSSSPFNLNLDEHGKKVFSRPFGLIFRKWM